MIPPRVPSEVSRQGAPVPRVAPSRPAARRRRPWVALLSWCSSLIVHAAVFALLYAFILPHPKHPPGPEGEQTATVRWVRRVPKPVTPPSPTPTNTTPRPSSGTDARPAPTQKPADLSPTARSENASATRSEARVEVSRAIGAGATFSPPPLPSRSGQTRRSATVTTREGFGTRGAGKTAALGHYGGDAHTEDAVSRGLRWLAAHRDARGGWRAGGYTRQCRHFVPCRGAGGRDYDVGVTSMAVLAFLGAGHLPGLDERAIAGARSTRGFASGPYGPVVKAALDYLLREQATSGCFGMSGNNYMYNHAITTFAMAEAYALTGDPRYGQSTVRAVQFSASSQQSGGGWDYTSRSSGRDDLSITGWQVMALMSAQKAGIDVPSSTLSRLRDSIDRAITPEGIGIYANRGTDAGRRGINMVAVGLLSRVLLHEPPDRRSMLRAAELLNAPHHVPDWEKLGRWDKHFQSYYYWYTASLALFLHSAGRDRERWDAWNYFLRKELLRLQSRRPHEEGSWRPEPNWIGVSGGRVYATAINVLTLETYYRYKPLAPNPRTARKAPNDE